MSPWHTHLPMRCRLAAALMGCLAEVMLPDDDDDETDAEGARALV